MEWQLAHHPRNVETVRSLSFNGPGYNAHAGIVTIGPDQVMFQIKKTFDYLEYPAACRGHKTDGVFPVESRSITPQGGKAAALPLTALFDREPLPALQGVLSCGISCPLRPYADLLPHIQALLILKSNRTRGNR